jgi:hypothetical protein
MPSSPDASARSWVAIGPASLLDMLVPLRDEHGRFGSAELLPVDSGHLESFLRDYRGERAALLVAEDPDQPSVRERFRSPMLKAGRDVVVGWLGLQKAELGTYARRAAALLARQHTDETTLVLLAPREKRYQELVDELETMARSLELSSFRWSAERIRASPLIHALRLGAAAVLYSGHGNSRGWFAYGGLTSEMIVDGEPWSAEQTNAVVFSLSCSTGKARAGSAGGGRAVFADGLVAGGAAGAVLAPFKDPLHSHSRALARAIVGAMAAGSASLCDVVRQIEEHDCSLDGYAVVGDPALAMRSSIGAAARGAAVFAPRPDAALATSPRWS